jgi:hypothetical protein
MVNGRVRSAMALTMSCVVVGLVVKINADETSVDARRAELVTVARKAYESIEADFKQNRVVIDDVYMWSRRLMQAELQQGTSANAAAEHTQRMSNLNDYVLEQMQTNPKWAGRKLHLQSEYYLLDAKLGEAAK